MLKSLNHLFQSIAFELTISGTFVKEKPRSLSLNRIAQEEPWYFPYYEKIVMPSTSISRKYLARHAASNCLQPRMADVQKPGGLLYVRSGMLVFSGTNQGSWSHLRC